MNYLIIQNSETPSTKVPPNVVQIFTDEELQIWHSFLESMKVFLKKDTTKKEMDLIYTMSNLMEQWRDHK